MGAVAWALALGDADITGSGSGSEPQAARKATASRPASVAQNARKKVRQDFGKWAIPVPTSKQIPVALLSTLP